MNILMVASENDAIPGGKVGGIGDVVRDIPPALASDGHQVNVITPSYGVFSQLPGTSHCGQISIKFKGQIETAGLYQVPGKTVHDGVTLWAIEHPIFSSGGVGNIYCNDPSDRPFATDAIKFALFSAAVCQAIKAKIFGDLDVIHLHDWHAATVALLRAYDPHFSPLKKIRTVYTIHNLALQGVRPLSGDDSALKTWFPDLKYDNQQINDPRAKNCINLMRTGIRLSDKVHAVSPTYAKEILLPSDHQQGYFGGEGLENDLQEKFNNDQLFGILNGCEYSPIKQKALPLKKLLGLCEPELLKWIAKNPVVDSAHLIAMHRLTELMKLSASKLPTFVMTSVGRITDQKVLILKQIMADGQTALEQLLDVMGDKGLFIMLGSGDAELESFLTKVAANKPNFLFLKGYAETLPNSIYASGDLFLMPSSFEPCGISQMLSMRNGQPCLVHGVGGLCDTVLNNQTGFVFNANSFTDQALSMIKSFESIKVLFDKEKTQWNKIKKNALKERFLWKDTADQYLTYLYKK